MTPLEPDASFQRDIVRGKEKVHKDQRNLVSKMLKAHCV